MLSRLFNRRQRKATTTLTRPKTALALHHQAKETCSALMERMQHRPLDRSMLDKTIRMPDQYLEDILIRVSTWRVLYINERVIPSDSAHYTIHVRTLDDLTIAKNSTYTDLTLSIKQLCQETERWLTYAISDTNEESGKANFNRRLTSDYVWELTQLLHTLLNL